jgi:hypothetical protein
MGESVSDPVAIAIVASFGPTLIGLLSLAHQIVLARKMEKLKEHVERVARPFDKESGPPKP